MRWFPAWLTVLWVSLPTPARAQQREGVGEGKLSVGISIGTSSFSGAARGNPGSGDHLLFSPYRPTMLGLLVSWGREHLRIEGSARYGEPGLAFRGIPIGEEGALGNGVLIVSENAFRVASFGAGGSIHLFRLRGGPVLRASAAVTLERWSAPGAAVRTLAGGQGGLAMELALTGSLSARAEGELGYTPASPFHAGDLPEGFTPRSTWRRSLGVAVVWRP